PSLSPRRALADQKCPARKSLVCFPPGGVAATRSFSHVLTYAPSLAPRCALPDEKHPARETLAARTRRKRQVADSAGARWWVWDELNFRPHPYQGCALTN